MNKWNSNFGAAAAAAVICLLLCHRIVCVIDFFLGAMNHGERKYIY